MPDPIAERLMHATLFEVFGQRDSERRREAIRRTYTEDVLFADADGAVEGHDALNAKAQSILDGAPQEFVFQSDGEVYQLHDLSYLAWTFGPEGQPPVVRGADMGFIRDGLLAKVYTVLFR